MEERFKKSIIFGVATFGILVIASVIGDEIIGKRYYRVLISLFQFSPILSVIMGIFGGMALEEWNKAAKAGGSIGFIGFFMVFLSLIIFSEADFEGEIFIAFAIVCVISGVGGGFLGRYFSPLFYFTPQQQSNRYSNQPNEERYERRQSSFDRTMNNVQNEAEKQFNTKNEGRQNHFENTPSSSTETEPPQPAEESRSNVCSNCGREVEDDWNVCIDCGTSLK